MTKVRKPGTSGLPHPGSTFDCEFCCESRFFCCQRHKFCTRCNSFCTRCKSFCIRCRKIVFTTEKTIKEVLVTEAWGSVGFWIVMES